MMELLDVLHVEPLADYRLALVFENGERRIFDMTPLLHKKPFHRLKEERLFRAAHVAWGTVAWPGGIDIAPETLYGGSLPSSEADGCADDALR